MSKSKNSGFWRLKHEDLQALLARDDSSWETARVYLAVGDLTIGFGKTGDELSLSRISRRAAVDVSHVCRALKRLKKLGLYSQTKGKGQKIIRRIVWPPLATASPGSRRKGKHKGAGKVGATAHLGSGHKDELLPAPVVVDKGTASPGSGKATEPLPTTIDKDATASPGATAHLGSGATASPGRHQEVREEEEKKKKKNARERRAVLEDQAKARRGLFAEAFAGLYFFHLGVEYEPFPNSAADRTALKKKLIPNVQGSPAFREWVKRIGFMFEHLEYEFTWKLKAEPNSEAVREQVAARASIKLLVSKWKEYGACAPTPVGQDQNDSRAEWCGETIAAEEAAERQIA